MQLKSFLRKSTEFGISLTAIATLILAGCGDGGSSTISGGVAKTTLSISPSLGMFKEGATVRVRDQSGKQIGSGFVNASGVASIDIPSSSQAPLLVEAGQNGDQYYDEKLDQFVAISGVSNVAIRALIPDFTIISHVAVTAFTEVAVGSLINASGILPTISTSSALGANDAVAQSFGISDLLLPPTLAGSSAVTAALSTTPADLYAAKLATLANMAGINEDALKVAHRLRDSLTGIVPASSVNEVVTAFNAAVDRGTCFPTLINSSAKIAPPSVALSKLNDLVTAAGKNAQLTQVSHSSSNPTNSLTGQNLETVTVKNLNKHQQGGTLMLGNSVSDTLSIPSDGSWSFSTPMTSAARWEKVISQPAGQVCSPTRNRMDVIDPYTGQLITSNTAHFYCFESPCVNTWNKVGLAPAPTGLKKTKVTDTTIELDWTKQPWAGSYWIYYGTDSVPVKPDSNLSNGTTWIFSDPGSTSVAINQLTPDTTYYFVVASEYRSPANLDVCKSSASTIVSVTTCSVGQEEQDGVCVAPATGGPTVTNINPNSGAVGTTFTITGTNFSTNPSSNAVSLNGITATVTSASSTILTVTVPSGATTGPITVTTTSGTGTSVSSFTVIPTCNSSQVLQGTVCVTASNIISFSPKLPITNSTSLSLPFTKTEKLSSVYSVDGKLSTRTVKYFQGDMGRNSWVKLYFMYQPNYPFGSRDKEIPEVLVLYLEEYTQDLSISTWPSTKIAWGGTKMWGGGMSGDKCLVKGTVAPQTIIDPVTNISTLNNAYIPLCSSVGVSFDNTIGQLDLKNYSFAGGNRTEGTFKPYVSVDAPSPGVTINGLINFTPF